MSLDRYAYYYSYIFLYIPYYHYDITHGISGIFIFHLTRELEFWKALLARLRDTGVSRDYNTRDLPATYACFPSGQA